MPLSLPKDCVRETGVIDISRFLGLWTGDAVDLTVIVAKLGQLLLNSGNRRHRRSGYRVSRPVIGVVGRMLLLIVVIVPETEWVTPPIRASIPISATVVRATIPTASVPVMAVATAMPAVVTSDKVAIPAEMAAVESPTMEPSPVKPSATMASAAVGECSWSDRQHSGKDYSDNLKSAHYTIPFAVLSGRSSWNDNRMCRFNIS
jgi:hypothetical protein